MLRGEPGGSDREDLNVRQAQPNGGRCRVLPGAPDPGGDVVPRASCQHDGVRASPDRLPVSLERVRWQLGVARPVAVEGALEDVGHRVKRRAHPVEPERPEDSGQGPDRREVLATEIVRAPPDRAEEPTRRVLVSRSPSRSRDTIAILPVGPHRRVEPSPRKPRQARRRHPAAEARDEASVVREHEEGSFVAVERDRDPRARFRLRNCECVFYNFLVAVES